MHEVVPPDVDEREEPGEEPTAMATRLAREKALAVAASLDAEGPPRFVLGADTIVVLDGIVLGKPADAAHARRMLARLCGRRHRVVTGVAVVHSATRRHWTTAVNSHVEMRAAEAEEIAVYVATGEPLDKAGGYAVQGEGGRRFVTAVEGSESNVIGLPVEETLALLERAARELAAAPPEPPDRGS